MGKTLAAVYENGVLRPLEPLLLREQQRVTVTVEESVDNSADPWVDHDYHASLEAWDEPEPTLDEVRKALSTISGKLSDAVRAERDARG
jgi:predicted DNA-binding antitoxin AbrB/MazE fold protein